MKKLLYILTAMVFVSGNKAFAQPIYSNTSASLFYSPAYISSKTGLPVIYLDDVNIPSSFMGTTDSLDVTAITFGFGKYGRQIPLWVDFFYSTVNTHAVNLNAICSFPPVHFDSLFAYGRNMFGNLFKTFGDSLHSSHTLFRVKTTKDALKTGYNTFFVGMSFSISSDSAMGYVHGPLYTIKGSAQKTNLTTTWTYDGVRGDVVKKVNGNPGAFYLVIWGKPAGSNMQPVPLVVNALTQTTIADEMLWGIYPNPVSGNTQLQFKLAQSSKVKIEIVSQTGLSKGVIDKHILPAGNNTVTLNLSFLPAGMYILNLYINGKIYSKTIYR